MKEKQEVKAKMRNLMERCLKERKRKYLTRSPNNCASNEKIRIHGIGSIGTCKELSKRLTVASEVFVCDSQEICDSCDSYSCMHTEESVERDFNEIIRNPSLCGQEYPKLAILIWVLEGDIKKENILKKISSFFKELVKW